MFRWGEPGVPPPCPGRDRSGGARSGKTTFVGAKWGLITADTVRGDDRFYGRRICRVSAIGRNSRRVCDLDGRVARVSSSPSVLVAAIDVEVKFRIGVHFDAGKGLLATNQSQRAVGTRSCVGQLCRAVAADSIASNYLHTEIDLFGKERHRKAGTAAGARARVVERAQCAWLRVRVCRVRRAIEGRWRGGGGGYQCVCGR